MRLPIKSSLLLLVLAVAVAGYFYLYPRTRPNLILIVLDTLRVDHLGVYGYERPTTTNLDAFAKSAMVYRQAYTSAPWTPPSVGSMMTGLYASAHGMMPPDGRGLARQASSMLDASNLTLAEILKQHGYQTKGVTPNPWIKGEFGYDQGFEEYYYRERAAADEITRAGIKVVDSFDKQKPFFLFLHYLDPHDPYNPPEEFRRAFSQPLKARSYPQELLDKINLYDAEILFMDHELQKFFAHLKNKELWENTTILILGDHGEQFMEHGHLGHGYNLYNEELHVPFILKHGNLIGNSQSLVSPIDIFPTFLSIAAISPPARVQGISLLDQKALNARRGTISEIDRKYDWKSYNTSDGERLILDYSDVRQQGGKDPKILTLFNYKTDGGGEKPIQDPQLAKELKLDFDSLYNSVQDQKVVSKQKEISQGTLDELKSLGYLN